MVTGLYAALFMLFQFGLTLHVARNRMATKTSLGDGGDSEMAKRIRAHGNFVETVPIAIILMLIAELSGAPFWGIHLVGVALLIGRGMHVTAILKPNVKRRALAMYITAFSWFVGGGLCVWTAVVNMLG
jgi:uncharacterized membrane protein YecN with MAPEG domain